MKRLRVGTGLLFAAAGWVGLLSPNEAAGAVLDLGASLTVRVQELIDGEPASFSENLATFPAEGVTLPLTASGRVESTDLDGMLVAVGQGFAEFSDPTLSQADNPEELALEVACYSNAPNVVYSVTAAAEETRTIVFTNNAGSDIAAPEFQFRRDGTREIESRVFISGAILVWTPDLDTDDDGFPNTSLDGLSVDVALTVSRLDDEDDADPEALFETSVSMTGAGDTLNGPDASGSIVIEESDIDALVDEGLDETSADVLRTVAENGTLTIVIIPRQEHPYRYEVLANETFLLRAELTADIRNVTDGSGIAVAIGRPFGQLTDFIEHALEGTSPTTVEQSINAVVAKNDVGLIPADGTDGPRMCGALGVEVIPMLMTLGLLPGNRRFRSWPR